MRAKTLMRAGAKKSITGVALSANATIQELARTIVNDARKEFPIEDEKGKIIGSMNRQEALDVLLGDK